MAFAKSKGAGPAIALLVLLFNVSRSYGADLVFYQDVNFSGFNMFINGDLGQRCVEISPEFNDNISSINTNGACIIAFEDSGCNGRAIRIAPGTSGHSDLRDVNFNDCLTSFRLC